MEGSRFLSSKVGTKGGRLPRRWPGLVQDTNRKRFVNPLVCLFGIFCLPGVSGLRFELLELAFFLSGCLVDIFLLSRVNGTYRVGVFFFFS